MHRYVWMLLLCLLFAGTLFATSECLIDTEVSAKQYAAIFGLSIIGLYYSIYSLTANSGALFLPNFPLIYSQMVAAFAFIESLYGLGQFGGCFQGHNGHVVTGNFSNPSGLAASLVVAIPFSFYCFMTVTGRKKILFLFVLVVMAAVIIISESRSGIISLTIMFLLTGLHYMKLVRKQKILLMLVVVLIAIFGLYFMKKNSADGRLLIWRCSLDMVKDRPLAGFGAGGFAANYMNYQAKFFSTNPDNKYIMLSDNVGRPFNEYIGLIVNYGLVGFISLLLLVGLIARSYWRCKNCLFARMTVCGLIGAAIFAFFSYPFEYPFVTTLIVLNIIIIIVLANYSIPIFILRTARWLLIPICALIFIITADRMKTEMKWRETSDLSSKGKTKEVLPEYKNLHGKLSQNRCFLYNYAAELYSIKDYSCCLQIATECERIFADYWLQMMMGYCCIIMSPDFRTAS